jgi:DNA-directed RNA polymerase subunit beta'
MLRKNLATGRRVEKGEVVGVIAAQVHWRTGNPVDVCVPFHQGGTASTITSESEIVARYNGTLEIDELRTLTKTTETGENQTIVIGRTAEMRIVDNNTRITLSSYNIPYGAVLSLKNGDQVKEK